MQWSDDAILLSTRKFGENKAVARVFARNHGVYGGVVRGATSKTLRGILQAGNAVSVTWNARLSEQMGAFKVEPAKPFAAFVMMDKRKLAALTSACALLEAALPERHPYPKLYMAFYDFLQHMAERDDWQETYIRLELAILAESGFGLDLTRCAATGTTENLMYVSPKSGRAVSESAGEPYKEKLLRLPKILWRDSKNREHRIDQDPAQSLCDSQDWRDGLTLTGYFLEHWLIEPHGKKLPAARRRLCEMLKETEPA